MQLRSGTVISSNAAQVTRTTDTNVRDPTYKISAVEQAKQQVRQKVKERQRKMADRHAEKAVDQILGVMSLFIKDFDNTDNIQCDPVMEKIRIITSMFGYANAITPYVMMHSRLMKLRSTMLKQCVKFSKDANAQIKIRIKTAQETMTDRKPEDLHNYYMAHLNAMQTELDQFTKTYKNRL